MTTLDRGVCKDCGAAILWIKNENGKAEPFDAKAVRVLHVDGDKTMGGATFRVGNRGELWASGESEWELDTAHLSHFVTCPKAAQFKRERGST